jgi:hypothetical protein
MKKLKVNYLKAILSLLFTSLIVLVIFYLSFGSKALPLNSTDIIILIVWLGVTIIFFVSIFYAFGISYDNKACYITRFGKTEQYDFDNVLYIDEPYTIKHKALTFYDKNGKLRFISFDKDKKLLEIFKTHCKKAITREEFISKFPNIRL